MKEEEGVEMKVTVVEEEAVEEREEEEKEREKESNWHVGDRYVSKPAPPPGIAAAGGE